MRAASLAGVLVFARILVLADHQVEWSVWTLPAFLWQDLLFVLCFAAIDAIVRREWLGWMLYVASVGYSAINVPIARAVSSPLTWPMLRATGGELADSITYYATPLNVALLVGVALVAVGLPFAAARLKPRPLQIAATLSLVIVVIGPFAVTRIDTRGHHRNVVFALVMTVVPRVDAEAAEADWRASPFNPPEIAEPVGFDGTSLDRYRGVARDQNVVLVILESVGARYLKPYGANRDPMPHLSELAERSMLFENAYVVYPESIKGLVAILSSISPAFDSKAEQYEHVGTRSIASELSDAGYRTGLFHSGRFMYLGMNSVIRGRGFDVLEDAGHISGEHNSSFGVDEPSTVKRVLSWIDESPANERFFLTYMPVAGHHPYDTPEPGPYPEDNDLDRYHNAMHYADEAIGQLIRGLRDRSLEQNTLLIVVGDHGQAFGQHADNFGHTFFLYEENIHVPLMIAAPAMRDAVRVSRVVSVLDVAPTIMELCGRSVPTDFQGSSLLHPRQQMALFFTDYSLGFLGLRDGKWKLIHELESGRSNLFDLGSDPDERHNVAGDSPEQAESYRQHLLKWCAAQRALLEQDAH
ncbi:MAG: sulfatase [Planctomycetota bacterium]|nr:sulfatase [Planctomycetota bacterium]